MKLFFIADIMGVGGREIIKKELQSFRMIETIDIVVANAENTADGFGITPNLANELFSYGVDIITLGNHTWDKKEIKPLLEDKRVVRPLNYPDPSTAGNGYSIAITSKGVKVCVMSVLGRVFMNLMDCPFRKMDEILEKLKDQVDVIIVDVHAEATSEKMALGWYLDGRVAAVIGTHTHVQTADEKILTNGTAYITDAGLTGAHDSVIGIEKQVIINRFLTQLPHKYDVANKKVVMEGVLLEIDDKTFKVKSIKRIRKGDMFSNEL